MHMQDAERLPIGHKIQRGSASMNLRTQTREDLFQPLVAGTFAI